MNTDNCKINCQSEFAQIIKFLKNFSFEKSLKDEHEKLCFNLFLYVLNKEKQLKFPFAFKKTESPDFQIRFENKIIGVEHTISTNEIFKVALSEFKKSPTESFLELSFYTKNSKISKRTANKGIRKPKERLIGAPMYGNNPENEWVELLVNTIESKIKTYNKPHFKRYCDNHLIVEDNTPFDFYLDHGFALEVFIPKLLELKSSKEKSFEFVHIISNGFFFFDNGKDFKAYDVSKKNLAL